jgi:hypothetical protein
MHRLFGLLALGAAGFGLYLLLGTEPEPRVASGRSSDTAPVAYGVWAVGLLMGLTLAWLAGVQWSTVPERARLWFRLQRRRLGWAVVGGLCTAILLLF